MDGIKDADFHVVGCKKVTLGLYTHIVLGAEKNAVECLPNWAVQTAKATGTDGNGLFEKTKPPKIWQTG
jgi:hypothetical protein